jgi:hypothetical protein
MITIVKGSSKLIVTKGTFEEQYKNLGYQIASEKKGATNKVAPILEEEKDQEENQEKTLKDMVEETTEEDKISEKYGLKNKETIEEEKDQEKINEKNDLRAKGGKK